MIKIALPIKDTKLTSYFRTVPIFRFIPLIIALLLGGFNPVLLHQPDSIPIWLAKKGVSDVITADIGLKAIKILTRHKINVFAGVKAKDTKNWYRNTWMGYFKPVNLCDH